MLHAKILDTEILETETLNIDRNLDKRANQFLSDDLNFRALDNAFTVSGFSLEKSLAFSDIEFAHDLNFETDVYSTMSAAYESFVVMLQNVRSNAAEILARSPDALIAESGITARTDKGLEVVTANELQAFKNEGIEFAAYLNVSVADDLRAYWDDDWTTDGADTSPLEPGAPSWLQGQPLNEFGYLVDYTDPGWQVIVKDQAVVLANAGYTALFLDDVGRYFNEAILPGTEVHERARAMIEFIIDIHEHVFTVTGVDMNIVTNGDPFILTAANFEAPNDFTPTNNIFLSRLDGMLLESYLGINLDGTPFLDAVESNILNNSVNPNIAALALEFGGTAFQNFQAQKYLDANHPNILSFFALDAGYGDFGFEPMGADNNNNTLLGLLIDDIINGFGGDDIIRGQEGADILRGDTGNDILIGGPGDDVILGQSHNDILRGNNGDDILQGGGGDDDLDGGSGHDRMFAGAGDDMVNGGGGDDRVVGQLGNDDLFGDDGNDVIIGGGGLDDIHGGIGNDRLIGQADADVFHFEDNSGNDIIVDFEDGIDSMDFSAHSTVNSFGDLTLTQKSTTVLIEFGTDSILLRNMDVADLTAADFDFGP